MKLHQIHVTGMTCTACAARIEKVLRKVEGVQSARVSLALSQATIHYEPTQIGLDTILEKIEKLGYGATDRLSHPQAGIEAETGAYRIRFVIAACLSVPLLWAMMAHVADWPAQWTPDLLMEPVFQWVLATLLQFGVGFPFYYGAYQAMIHRTANMDTLVALSTSVAYFYSHYVMFESRHSSAHPTLYFDTIAMVMTAVLLGKWLETMAKGRALKQLSALYELQVKRVRVVRSHGEEWISADQVQIGDRIRVNHGEWISIDGFVQSGSADADESMLTGESTAVAKGMRDRVYAGTRCLVGRLDIVVDKNHGETRLSQMIGLIESAQQGKPAIQLAVDRIAGIFVPVMIGCAALTYAGWLWFSQAPDASETAMRHALSVLLIACPCALGLATPVSILIATGSSAQRGVLFKDGRSLEGLRRTDVVLLDKTGTLTEGRPQLTAIHTANGSNAAYVLSMSAALASRSAHPLAQAIVRAAQDKHSPLLEAQKFQERVGKGMEGYVKGEHICVGNRKWLLEQGIQLEIPPDQPGFTRLYVAVNGKCIGSLVLIDKLRKDARKIVQELKRRADVWMVTGDEEQAAVAVAAAAGIDQMRAGMLPDDKLAFIRELQHQGRSVAMIGDGINDAAALAVADVGMAMGGGADAAKQAGDIVLIGNKLFNIIDAYTWSRQTMRNVHQNLLFALLYNAITVPLAACGYLDPRIACIGMAASSVLVVANALRLQLKVQRLDKNRITVNG
ncbi:cation-translocating P-type ATPase [Paenibacillus sp. EZ-K15]|uniref:heavy metal translocating P-type ATPase n=1 Tax=Paenibacillus sp. EZ-K15 TaxID=2044275 RepID=UPI000BF6B38D|nr:cation-translocating P-type ATPase [Paenibacillus sp. EZ-K15]